MGLLAIILIAFLTAGQGHHCLADRELDGAGNRINDGKTAMARLPIPLTDCGRSSFYY